MWIFVTIKLLPFDTIQQVLGVWDSTTSLGAFCQHLQEAIGAVDFDSVITGVDGKHSAKQFGMPLQELAIHS